MSFNFCVTFLHLCIKTSAFSKQLSLRKNLLCFNLRDFKLHTTCYLTHQLHRICNFEFKSTNLIQDLQLHFNKIWKHLFHNNSFEFGILIASFFENLYGWDLVSLALCFSFMFVNFMCYTCKYFMFVCILDTLFLFIHLIFDYYHS